MSEPPTEQLPELLAHRSDREAEPTGEEHTLTGLHVQLDLRATDLEHLCDLADYLLTQLLRFRDYLLNSGYQGTDSSIDGAEGTLRVNPQIFRYRPSPPQAPEEECYRKGERP